MENKIERIRELVKYLNKRSYEYYVLDKPTISDSEFDKLFDELKVLESETGFILSISPTQKVGYQVMSKLNKVSHPIPLRSLDKTKSLDELSKFIKDKEVLFMIKADGLTVEHLYENGMHVQSSTRGDSETGEEITHNAKFFKNLPLAIPFKGKLRIAGESIIKINDFEEMNSKLKDEDKYATPRNLVAGSVRQLDSQECSKRNVNFFAFNLLEADGIEFENKSQQLEWLYEQGFEVIPFILYKKDEISKENINNIEKIVSSMYEEAKEKFIPIDGLVISYNNIKHAKSLGETAHHPLHSIALKANDEIADTTLTGVEWNVSRTSAINPVALFKTVIIDNTEVSRASLHNLSYIEDMGLNIGCNIGVVKRNLIIPHVEVNYDEYKYGVMEYPTECPICKAKTVIKQDGDAKFLYCTNEDCDAKILKKMNHFVSKQCMNIDGLSEATLSKFLDNGFIETIVDIYKIEKYKEDICALDGFGTRSYNNLLKSIEASKSVKLQNFICALGIPQIGVNGSKLLAKNFKTIDELKQASLQQLLNIKDFGSITAESVNKFFNDEKNIELLDELLKYITIETEEVKTNASNENIVSLEGKIFVVTGSVIYHKNRKEIEKKIEDRGGKLASSVSSKTNFLLCNETSTSSKYQSAIKNNVPIITEEDFLKMIGEM